MASLSKTLCLPNANLHGITTYEYPVVHVLSFYFLALTKGKSVFVEASSYKINL